MSKGEGMIIITSGLSDFYLFYLFYLFYFYLVLVSCRLIRLNLFVIIKQCLPFESKSEYNQ